MRSGPGKPVWISSQNRIVQRYQPRMGLSATAHFFSSVNMVVAELSIWAFEVNTLLSSRSEATIGIPTPSTIGIIFKVVASCLATCTERKPPEKIGRAHG